MDNSYIVRLPGISHFVVKNGNRALVASIHVGRTGEAYGWVAEHLRYSGGTEVLPSLTQNCSYIGGPCVSRDLEEIPGRKIVGIYKAEGDDGVIRALKDLFNQGSGSHGK